MQLRSATANDMNAVYAIFHDAIDTMNQEGIPQWDDVYPNPAILDDDLANGELFVTELDDGTVAAAVVLNNVCNDDCRADYEAAAWQGPSPYVLVHRLCVSPHVQNKGVGRTTMLAVEAWARTNGYVAIRLDAFSHNPYALRMYDRLGYQKRGEATWRKGLFYLMEKQL